MSEVRLGQRLPVPCWWFSASGQSKRSWKTVIAEPLLSLGSSPPLISALLALKKLVPWFTPNTRFHEAVWWLAL